MCPTRVGCLRNAQVLFTAVLTSCCQSLQFVIIIIAAAVSFLGSAAFFLNAKPIYFFHLTNLLYKDVVSSQLKIYWAQ